jgi:hypothetical protein
MLLNELIRQLRERGLGEVSPNCIRWHADRGFIGTVARDWRGHRTFSIENLNRMAEILASRQPVQAGA